MAPSETGTSSTSLDKLFEEIDEERMRSLEQELKIIKRLERAQSKGKFLTEEEQDLLRIKPFLCSLLNDLPDLFGLPRSGLLVESSTSATKPCNHDLCLGSSQVGSLEKGRYLCISYGFMICCLDLKRKRDESKEYCSLIQPLPDISTLRLLEECIPVSMGLFKVHSNAYMLGGQEFPRLNNPPYIWETNPFSFLYVRCGVKGSALETRHLSLLGSELSLTECNLIGPLNKPKVWPIVEKFGNKIHVIESIPETFSTLNPNTIPTHEVLDLNDLDRGWMELGEVGVHIAKHIAVGDRLYATRDMYCSGVFDSQTFKWEWHTDRPYHDCDSLLSVKHVTQIFQHGFGSCTGLCLRGETREPLYVVIALGEHDWVDMIAVAYLVSSRGQVLCFQRLPHFFDKFNLPFQGNKQGTVIKVAEDEETMCAIFEGITDTDTRGITDTLDEFICITTFHVKLFDAARVLDRDLMSRMVDEYNLGKFPSPIVKNFVKVEVEDLHVYRRQADPVEYDGRDWQPGYKACFL